MEFLGSGTFTWIAIGAAIIFGFIYIALFVRPSLTSSQGKSTTDKKEKRNASLSAGHRNTGNVQDILGFEDISNGIIRLPGRRFRIVLEVMGTVNFPLRSSEEQDMVEASFSALLSTLATMKSPVQMYVQARKLDLLPQIQEIEERKRDLPEPIQRYADEHKEYLRKWMYYAPFVTKRYLILPFDAPPDYDMQQIQRELWRRKEAVEKQISRYLSCRQLSTQEIIDLLYNLYNKGKATSQRSSDAFKEGFFDLHVKGVRLSEALQAASVQESA